MNVTKTITVVNSAATQMQDHVTASPVDGLILAAFTTVEATYGFSAITIPAREQKKPTKP